VTLFAVLALGFVLGLRHATDADHVVALTALVGRGRSARSGLALGAFWGLGHSVTLLCVGGAIVAFGLVIPPGLGLSLEMFVAIMLILLGTLNLTGTAGRFGAALPHFEPAPSGDHSRSRRASALAALRRGVRPLAVGVVHGLAGSAAVALLVLTTLKNARSALAYLTVFGLGTIAGMMLLTATLALPLRLATLRFASAERVLARATGALSLLFGLFLAYRIGFVDGLLLGDPKWTPE
jgi:high-affinity nickel-transport protein